MFQWRNILFVVLGLLTLIMVKPSSGWAQDSSVTRFAVIGDFGNGSTAEGNVANLVKSWQPDFVVTTGDNNYPDGEASTIDSHIGRYYSEFIGNYHGQYGSGSNVNRFWPSLGNHDWHTITCNGSNCSGAYFDYFTLPNNERYYDQEVGPVHLFTIDSDSGEPDGRSASSIQANWLQGKLTQSTACLDVVYFHHPPYSSGRHGSTSIMRWPFASWGADVVMNGHDHLYERISVNGMPYFVAGASGAGLYNFENLGKLPSEAISEARYNDKHGALLVTVLPYLKEANYEYYNVDGQLIDSFSQTLDCNYSNGFSPKSILAGYGSKNWLSEPVSDGLVNMLDWTSSLGN